MMLIFIILAGIGLGVNIAGLIAITLLTVQLLVSP